MPRKSKKPVRDPNVPVLSWKYGATTYEVLIAGPGEFISRKYNPAHGKWSDNSIILRETGPSGFNETEKSLWDANFWGWIGRLICDGTIPRDALTLLSKSDSYHYNVAHGLEKPEGEGDQPK